jgi:hypothetical protein
MLYICVERFDVMDGRGNILASERDQVKLPRGEVQAAGATHVPSNGCRRPPPPSSLVRPSSLRSEGRAQLVPPTGETRCAEEGRSPAPLLRVCPRASVSLALGRGRRRGVGRVKVGGVDPARRGRRRVGGGPRAGAQAHLRRRGHAHLPVRRQTAHLPPFRRPARQAGT